MDPSAPQHPKPERRDHDSGRVAVPEIAELLHLQRPAAAVAAAAVVLLGLLVTLVAPSVLPANVVTGFVVGLLALIAAAATAVVLDGRDPVLRGPRHLRRDGHAVLARMAGPDPAEHGGPVLAAIERRLEGREHLGVVLTGTGTDPSELAVTLGRAAAAAGHTALVIDLRAPGAPGVADVGEGTVRLGEAARLAEDRPYAWIGAGVDREAAARAAAGVARRPPRDLKLLLVVAPDAATHVPEVLRACERTVLLVSADTQQRAMVTARLNALERAGGRPEAVVIGGVRVLPDGASADALGASVPGTALSSPDALTPAAPVEAPTTAAPAQPPTATAPEEPPTALEEPPTALEEPATGPEEPATTPGASVAADPEDEPERAVPPSPAPPPTVPEAPAPDEPEPTAPPAPEPDAPPVRVPDPETVAPETNGDLAAAPRTVDGPHELDTPPSRGDATPPVFRTAAGAESDRTVAASVGDTSVEGMAEPDALLTVAALDQLVSERRQRDAG